MKCNNLRRLFLIAMLLMGIATAGVARDGCRPAMAEGEWGYTITGTLLTPNGPVPMAIVGIIDADANGVLAHQASSVGGKVTEGETGDGTFTQNPDCTGTLIAYIYDASGNPLRTATWATVIDENGTEMRAIMTSLVVHSPAGNMNVPAVVTMNAKKVSGRRCRAVAINRNCCN